jgi:hypothetical protein
VKFEETIGGVHEVRKAAAETSAGYLIAVDAHGGGVVSVHQVAALVVEDRGGSQSALLQKAGGGEDEGGLAGAQESAEYREDGLAIRERHGTFICRNDDLIVAEGEDQASPTKAESRKVAADVTLLSDFPDMSVLRHTYPFSRREL